MRLTVWSAMVARTWPSQTWGSTHSFRGHLILWSSKYPYRDSLGYTPVTVRKCVFECESVGRFM